jgi:hypothetical protein
MYFLDIFTSYINKSTQEGNPLIKFVCGNSFKKFILFKISGVFVLGILFYLSDNLLKVSKIAFYIFLAVNIINVLNYLVKEK